ncbi:MAG: family 78 glycoside hydrolase catalytic domain [Clostridia bacterium]|nr:family 78 glycoside hydrolase catalytic domain [Clostridia bacterium]
MNKNNVFGEAAYIKESELINREYSLCDPAPLFRKEFDIAGNFQNACVYVQGLGIAEYYLNGKRITDDLFISPVSDYRKILWYNVYDVAPLLKNGRNTLGVMLGNGFYNESFKTDWGHYKAEWRDKPKFILRLVVDGKTAVVSDDSWKCTTEKSYIIYNQLRTGEYFDARKYFNEWTENGYDDSEWKEVIIDKNVPKGEFKECVCRPIREVEELSPVNIFRNKNGCVLDFGKNISGYAEVKIKQDAGDEISLQYCEEVDDKNEPKHNLFDWYPKVDFQRDKLICSGNTDVYKPHFTYHGFRYLEITGLKSEPLSDDYKAIFVHQQIDRKADFRCSDELLNKIYDGGIISTYSNMFYGMTDCLTREKLYWTNDAQASCEQILLNFDSAAFLEKWFEDIKATFDEEKGMTGIAPSPDWCYQSGPVCDCILYEIPYRIYQYTGNSDIMVKSLPCFYAYADFLNRKIEEKYDFWLADWMGNGSFLSVPKEFIFEFYRIKAYRTIVLAEGLAKNIKSKDLLTRYEDEFKAKYNKDGYAVYPSQSALAIQICNGLYTDFDKVREQLTAAVEADGDQMRCGMVGIQYLFDALTICGRADLAVKIITTNEPGYKTWFDSGATSLWELWDGKDIGSHNHHMYSCVIGWFIKSLLGYNVSDGGIKTELAPVFPDALDFCEGNIMTDKGKLELKWKREENGNVIYLVDVPSGLTVCYKGKKLHVGKNSFTVTV